MKATLYRLGAQTLSFTVGVAIFLVFTNHPSDEASLPPPVNLFSPGCPGTNELIGKGGYVVISVPNNDEFYIGKHRVEPSQITGRVMKLLGNQSFCDRVVFIKGTSKVRFDTLDLIVRHVKDADVNRIEFVLDRKKRPVK